MEKRSETRHSQNNSQTYNHVSLKYNRNLNSLGAVQTVNVCSIDYEHHSAGVEWYEAGELKGKSIDFQQLAILNPDVQIIMTEERPQERLTYQLNWS